MHQDRRRLAQTCPEFDHPLEQAFIRQSNKNDKENCQALSYTCRTSLFTSFFVFYTHYAKDHLPKSNAREKAAKWTSMSAKQVT